MKVLLRNPAAAARRRTRTVAAIGAAVAAGTAGLMVLAVGTAAADEPGRCNETVKVRAEPNLDAPVVGVCEAGTAVQIGEIREGYLYLTDYQGWAAWEYLTIDDPAGTAPRRRGHRCRPTRRRRRRPGRPPPRPRRPARRRPPPRTAVAGDDRFDDDGVAAEDTPSTTPTADPTPGRR